MIETLAISGYRSLRNIILPLGRLNVVTGANGSGKSSLYRALRLLADAALNTVVGSLAREGGLPSTLWAGPETIARSVRQGEHPVEGTPRQKAVSLKLGFAGEPFSYCIDLGYPPPAQLRSRSIPRSSASASGTAPYIGAQRCWSIAPIVLCSCAPAKQPNRKNLSFLPRSSARPTACSPALPIRNALPRCWRCGNRARLAILRRISHGPGRSSARAAGRHIYTSSQRRRCRPRRSARNNPYLRRRSGAGPHCRRCLSRQPVGVEVQNGRFEVQLNQHGLLRSLGAAELSDGTLRFLLWTAALLTPRPPELMVLNEPETSLHPDLLPALARLIALAATRTQIVVVSHAPS